MKRKLFLGLAALAALTVTSCQKDLVINQVPEEQPIGFGTYVGRDAQTKARVIGKDDLLGPDKGFGVFAYYTGTLNFTEDQDDGTTGTQQPTPNFMYNQKVTGSKTGETYSWEYSPVKYWPVSADEKISFFAYAPYIATNTFFSDVTKEGVPTLNFTVDEDVAKQVDLLYATPVYDKKKPESTADDKTVAFTFNHALSRIGFSAKPHVAANTIKINSITLSGYFYTSGTMSLADGTFTNLKVNPHSTTNAEQVSEYDFEFNQDGFTGTTYTALVSTDGYLMTIPKTFTDNITITVDYDITVNDGTNTSAAINKTAIGTLTAPTFIAGKAYTIAMTIYPTDAITFSVTSVTGWDPTDGTDVTVNLQN